MSDQTMRRLAKPMLFLAAFIWGSSFFIMKGAVDVIPAFYLLAFRFTGGAVLLGLFCWKRWRRLTRDYWWRGAVIGVLLFLAYSVQTFGLQGTTPSKNAFLTAVYCVLVPFFYWAAAARRPDRYHIIAAVLCLTGVGLVSLSGDLTITWGDGLTLLCAVFYAAHIVAVSKFSKGRDIFLLTVIQFGATALCCWVGTFLTRGIPAQGLSGQAWGVLLYLAIAATALALLLQNVGQKYTDPSSAAVLLALEAPFGVAFSVLFAGESPTPQMYLGFFLIFLAVVCSETKFQFLPLGKARRSAEQPL